MYKSKLQELCQAKLWSLPNYSTSRDRPDHAPRFKASVVVNGVSFESSDLCKSSKEAQNEVARYAYEHFVQTEQRLVRAQSSGSATSSPTLSPSSSSPGSSSTNCLLNNGPSEKGGMLQRNANISESPVTHVNGSSAKDITEHGGLQHIYKTKLQNYAHKRNISLPIYSCKHKGPPHAVHFKASVTIDGKTFESPEFFRTLKEAEHAAAKVALSSLSEDGTQEEDSSVYKNLLQVLAQKEGFPLPSYATVTSGPSHLPTFISTVEIEGENFQGTAAKTKKQAESNAAKVAYCSLEEFMNQEVHPTETITASARSSRTLSKPGPSLIPRNKDSSDNVYASLRDPFPSVPPSTEDGQSSRSSASESSVDAVTNLNNDLPMESRSSFPYTKVQVFPRVPGIEFGEGTRILPISDDEWVAVSSNFPNQQGQNKGKGKQIVK